MRTLALVTCLAACSSDPSNVAGDFSVMVTNRDNGCNIANWTVGATNSATVTLTQRDNDVTANVTGLGAFALDLLLGGHAYTGKINDSDLALDLFGVRSFTTGNCTYTFNSEIRATINGDLLEGQLNYRTADNDNPDCAGLKNCLSFQDFSGTRTAR
ncbi:MAG TPA: hypothetical protein VFT22_34560 [Kofleriaceae bacterium]|nr:hypothetical protein [Kofleriaceae bacterium]